MGNRSSIVLNVLKVCMVEITNPLAKMEPRTCICTRRGNTKDYTDSLGTPLVLKLEFLCLLTTPDHVLASFLYLLCTIKSVEETKIVKVVKFSARKWGSVVWGLFWG